MAQKFPHIVGEFSMKYTNANLSSDAAKYDHNKFSGFLTKLANTDNGQLKLIAPEILCAMLCAQRRGDAVPALFHDLTAQKSAGEVLQLFLSIREVIALIFPFVGLPNCIPACLGLVGELRSRDIEVPEGRRRTDVEYLDYFAKGVETREAIYRGVGNPEVHWMMSRYFPDIAYATDITVFGYLIGGSLGVQSLEQSELILASAITAMGATRQARSHCKASMQLGNSIVVVKTVVEVANLVATWNGVSLPGKIDVATLADELQAEV